MKGANKKAEILIDLDHLIRLFTRTIISFVEVSSTDRIGLFKLYHEASTSKLSWFT